MGIITNSNSEVTRILGFSKSDVVGQKVQRIMPKVFADMHDNFIKNFLETSESKILGIERLVLAQSKDGYIVPCSLMIKVLPNLNDGIQIVGFLKDVEENNQTNSNFMTQGKIVMGAQSQEENKGTDKKMQFIMYNPNTNLVLGLTQNCFDLFGIPSSLVYGNSNNTTEFLIDSILPEVADTANQEKLKSTGILCTIDTSQLRQEFLLAQNDSDDEIDDQLENNYYEADAKFIDKSVIDQSNVDLLNSSGLNTSQILAKQAYEKKKKNRQERYRRARVKAMIVDEQEFFDTHIQTVQFMETNEEEEMEQNELNQFKKTMAITQNITINQQQQDNDGNVIGEDGQDDHPVVDERDSQGSGISLNEDVRMLKDFKQLMSEKNETKNIKILKYTVISIGIILITLVSVEYTFKGNQTDDVSIGQGAIYNSYYRRKVMADIIFYSRMLNLLAVGKYLPKDGNTLADVELQFKNNLSIYVDQLQSIQFSLIKSKITMQAKSTFNLATKEYPIIFMLQTGENRTYQNVYDDALFQFLTSASAIRNASLSSFNTTDTIESTQKNMFYIIQNGLFVLRKGSEEIAQDFYHFYLVLIDSYVTNFTVILSLAIVFLVGSQFILIPIVFSVHSINNKVLSLFGLIQQAKVKELADKCEKFKTTFLEVVNKDIIDNSKEVKKPEVKPKKDEHEEKEELNNSYMEVNNEEPNIIKKIDPKAIIKTPEKPREMNKLQSRDQDREQEKKEEEDADNIRSQKLLNSKTNDKIVLIFKFGFLTGVFMAYFIANYVMEKQFQDNIKKVFDHLHIIANRPSAVKFCVYMTFEEIVQNSPLIEDSKDLRVKFFDEVYQNERDIFQSIQTALPSDFNPYISLFNKFNYLSICDQQFSYNNFIMNSEECKAINQGLLSKGLSTTIVSVAMSTQEMINRYKGGDDSFNDLVKIFNSNEFEIFSQILKYLDPSQAYLNQIFISNIDSFLQGQRQIESIKFALFIVFLVLVFIIMWIPYNKGLSMQIWRIKGMLNMIPMDVIQNQENLKVAFLQGDIIQAVK